MAEMEIERTIEYVIASVTEVVYCPHFSFFRVRSIVVSDYARQLLNLNTD
jgi:hypothetical protein